MGAPPLPDNRETLAEQLVRYHYGEGSHFSCRMYSASTGESPDGDDRRRGARPRDSIKGISVLVSAYAPASTRSYTGTRGRFMAE
jgi:hypothetical protein